MTAHAETHTLTMKQAVTRALAQNPEVVMARLDEARAALAIRLMSPRRRWTDWRRQPIILIGRQLVLRSIHMIQ